MPRKCLMTWEGAPNFRWTKMYRGTRYRVTCEDLGVPRTKEDSYQAANAWWEKKLAETRVRKIDEERREALTEIERKISFASQHAPDLMCDLKDTKAQIETEIPGEVVLHDDAEIQHNLEIARLMGITIPEDLDPKVLQHLFGNQRIWSERLQRAGIVAKQKTLRHNLSKFLQVQQIRQQPATHKEMAAYLNGLLETPFWAPDTDIATINEQTVTSHYLWLSSKKYGWRQHNKVLGFFRRFVFWLWQEKVIDDIPRNLKATNHRKNKVHKEVKRYTGIAEVIKQLPSRHRLWAFLGLNCGMTNADLGALFWQDDTLTIGQVEEVGDRSVEVVGLVDPKNWTIRRRRAKTGQNPNTPTVTYKLWPETVALLKKLRSRHGLLFETKTGRPLYESRFDEDDQGNVNVKTKDLFATYWNRHDPKPPFSLGKFRSIAATALKEDKIYRQYEDYFLAHAPKSLADQHYGAESDKPFFQALRFIRKKVLKTAGSACKRDLVA